MGMFDTLRFNYRMPNGYQGAEYQTSDLDCRLDQYEVTTAGRLTRKSMEPDEEFAREHPDYYEAPVDTHFSGRIYISAYAGSPAKRECFELHFVAGNLQAIRDANTDKEAAYDSLEHTRQALASSITDVMVAAALAEAYQQQLIAQPTSDDERLRLFASMKAVLQVSLNAGAGEAAQ